MSLQNKALAERFHHDLFEAGNADAADELIAADFVWHGAGMPSQEPRGPEGVKQVAALYRSTFPDLSVAHDDVVAEGDTVAIRWTVRGTQRGALMGVPPTGKQVAITGIDVFRVANGKLAELWQTWDRLGLMQQLGVIPGPAA